MLSTSMLKINRWEICQSYFVVRVVERGRKVILDILQKSDFRRTGIRVLEPLGFTTRRYVS